MIVYIYIYILSKNDFIYDVRIYMIQYIYHISYVTIKTPKGNQGGRHNLLRFKCRVV